MWQLDASNLFIIETRHVWVVEKVIFEMKWELILHDLYQILVSSDANRISRTGAPRWGLGQGAVIPGPPKVIKFIAPML